MHIISEKNLSLDRPYINLKKLPTRVSLRKGIVNEAGFKNTYIIDQYKEALSNNKNYVIEFRNGIEKISINSDLLNNMLLAEINYSSRTGGKSAKFKLYFILKGIKYALPFSSFKDSYIDSMDILNKELQGKEELSYVKESFDNLEDELIPVDIELNLARLKEFEDKVNYKRNVDYFVINNIASTTSKYDIRNKTNTITENINLKVLRYDYNSRLYKLVSFKENKIYLKETDIICDFQGKYPTVTIYTEYGLGKLLDIENNVIPNANTVSLFANIVDLGLNIFN